MYHSALKPALDITAKLDYYENEQGVVFAWDITHGVTDAFWTADAVYTEPSWRAGYQKFLERAGEPGTSDFHEYLHAIRVVINALQLPSYVVIGKHMQRALQPPVVLPVKIHGYGALVGIWHTECLPENAGNIDELRTWVCERHETILDFSCGYGNIAQSARRFVCSDVNRHCVYYVAKEIMGYG